MAWEDRRVNQASEAITDLLGKLLVEGKLQADNAKPGGMITHWSMVFEYMDGDGDPCTGFVTHGDDMLRDLIVHQKYFEEWAKRSFRDWLGEKNDD